MKTFCAVDDEALVRMVRSARRRIVFIAPGLTLQVAKALGARFDEIDGMDITVVLDSDEDVCRIGYGEVAALQHLHMLAQSKGFWLKSQPGLRVGVLLADDQTLVWAPTPRSIEAPPDSTIPTNAAHSGGPEGPESMAPNGLMLGSNPGEQLANAVAAEGTATGPDDAEIGRKAITPAQVQETVDAHLRNPPIPVDLARVTRVFSTKLQFIEIKITRAKLSQVPLRPPNGWLNADVEGELKNLLGSSLFPFHALRDEMIDVPAFVNGVAAMGADRHPLQEPMSEALLERERRALEKKFVYDISLFGRLIEKDRKQDFMLQLGAYEVRLLAHAVGLRKLMDQQVEQVLKEATDLILARSRRGSQQQGAQAISLNAAQVRAKLQEALQRNNDEPPTVKVVLKDVTYEQTQNADFRDKVQRALPAPVRKRLGHWSEQFDAARERGNSPSI